MNLLQIKASNPNIAAWVSASAGTGKTKILTDRVIRLLLKDVQPNKILCLTFTNAAANEMQQRIRDKLQLLASSSEEQLSADLIEITGHKPTQQEISKVRTLYDEYLQQSEQVNIYTLHSYCQKILQKFPIEANVPPNFQILDDLDQSLAIKHIKKLMAYDPSLARVNIFLAENFHQNTIDEIFIDILHLRSKFSFKQLSNQTFEELIEHLEKGLFHHYQNIIQYPLLTNLIDVTPTIAQVKDFFLTKESTPRKRIVSANIAKPGSSLHDELLALQEQIYQLDQMEKEHHVKHFSQIIELLASKFLTYYEDYKNKKSLLDYDDLIIKTRNLLCDNAAREWILYKLDGGIEHILVDEAQDTSPEQWQIIEALIQEFFAGEGRSSNDRSIFVVGDEKQSIFSFQGADVESFTAMNKALATKLATSNTNFANINLDISYRSATEILDIVYDVFGRLKQKIGHNVFSEIPKIKAHRNNYPGKVELWPIISEEKEDKEFWQVTMNTDSSSKKLAQQIATFIHDEINLSRIVPATSRQACPGDFMVLFRTRNEFTLEVINEIKKLALPVSGLDRIVLADDLLVKDLIAVAKYVLNPLDDLNLAALLKSPLIGLSDNDLEILRTKQQEGNISYNAIIFEQDVSYRNACIVLQNLQTIFQNNCVTDFFQTICHSYNLRTLAYTIYGYDSLESIDELLKLTIKYVNSYDHSLQGFINWFESNQTEVKREVDNLNAIKIMTVHGSKGLQAPYVILCDTTSLPVSSERFIWSENKGILSYQSAAYIPESLKELKNQVKQKEFAEYLRLLYVGMTRAEDHLIICGYVGRTKLPENCWYQSVRDSMNHLGKVQDNGQIIYQNGNKVVSVLSSNNSSSSSGNIFPITRLNKSLSSQQLKYINDTTATSNLPISPLESKVSTNYGLVFHKILEDSVKGKNIEQMHYHPLINTLPALQQARIKTSIDKLIGNIEFTNLLTHNIKTELSIGTCMQAQCQIGRIDLLVEEGDIVKVIDYKTDAVPQLDNTKINPDYIQQLKFYQSTLEKLYPNKLIKTFILWLENGILTEV